MARRKQQPRTNDPMIGRSVIGQYRIDEKLGVGGMGAVYLAEQVSISRRAVIKVLHSRLHGAPDMAARFAIEAKAASNLEHPNIVTIYNYGEMEDGTLFLAMEYLEGQTLDALLKKQKKRGLPLDRAIPIIMQIANALGEAHRRGVIHRDLKPSNVMLVDRAGMPEFVKVLDFGIAKLDGAGVTSTGEVFGTPRYMSPEQLRGSQLDGRSDIYSVGLLLYEMIAGRSPFESDTPQGWMFKHIGEEPPPPSTISKRVKISPALEAVILRALAKSPTDRPPTMDAFAHEIEAAMRAPHVESPAVMASPQSQPTQSPHDAPAPKRRSRAKKQRASSVVAPVFARLVRPFRREKPKGWRAFVATTRGRITIAAVALATIVIVVLAMSTGGTPTAAAAADAGSPPAAMTSPEPESVATPPTPAAKPTTKPGSKSKPPKSTKPTPKGRP